MVEWPSASLLFAPPPECQLGCGRFPSLLLAPPLPGGQLAAKTPAFALNPYPQQPVCSEIAYYCSNSPYINSWVLCIYCCFLLQSQSSKLNSWPCGRTKRSVPALWRDRRETYPACGVGWQSVVVGTQAAGAASKRQAVGGARRVLNTPSHSPAGYRQLPRQVSRGSVAARTTAPCPERPSSGTATRKSRNRAPNWPLRAPLTENHLPRQAGAKKEGTDLAPSISFMERLFQEFPDHLVHILAAQAFTPLDDGAVGAEKDEVRNSFDAVDVGGDVLGV